MPRCCVPKCSALGAHRFPKDEKMQHLWANAIRRPKLKISSHTRICAKHFLKSDYELTTKSLGFRQNHRHYLKSGSIPSIFAWNNKKIFKPKNTCKFIQGVSVKGQAHSYDSSESNVSEKPVDDVNLCQDISQFEVGDPLAAPIDLETRSSERQRILPADLILADNESVYFFTGLENVAKFKFVLSTLLPMANDIVYCSSVNISLSVEDQFLLLLLKLRRNYPDLKISKIFGINKIEVVTILVTWIQFVSDIWSLIDICSGPEILKPYMPTQFYSDQINEIKPKNHCYEDLKKAAPKYTLVYKVEGKKGKLQIPSDLSTDQGSFEKDVGTICIDKDSGKMNPQNDSCDTQDHKSTLVYVVSSQKGKLRIPTQFLKYDKKLSKKRQQIVKVTRIYKILTNEIDKFYKPLALKIFFTCFMLCNFKDV